MNILKIIRFLFIVVGFGILGCEGEYFSSMNGLEPLLHTEKALLSTVAQYIDSMKKDLDLLEREINKIEFEHNLATSDTEDYLTNPLNVYRLLKRLDTDWNSFEKHIRNHLLDTNVLEQLAGHRRDLDFPTEDDVNGAAVALVRLQETYKLDTSELAEGILNGIKYGTNMTWLECFKLGEKLFDMRSYNHSREWLLEAMERLYQEDYANETVALDYMENVMKTVYHMGDLTTALMLSEKVLSIDVKRAKARYTKFLIKEFASEPEVPEVPFEPYHQTDEFKVYEQLCRSNIPVPIAKQNMLRCYYTANNQPFRLLAPFRVEEHSFDPLILTYHNIITDQKIQTLIDMAIPELRRSTVRTETAFVSSTSQYRISKNAWLAYSAHQYLQEMLRDLHDATGLDTNCNEALQVANYGLGGHYEPHWDFYTKPAQMYDGLGNRIITAMFYLSDVEQGGATAFPYLNIVVRPQKGNALVWYNLHRSLDVDYRTKHAGCPVLKGSKWIANIWIRDLEQAFAKPCLLQRDHETSMEYEAPSN